MFKKFLFIFVALQIPFAQKHLLLLGNIFLKPLGYSYHVDKVHGVFPFFLNINQLVVRQNKIPLIEGKFVYVDWRNLLVEQIVVKDTGGETDIHQTYNIIKKFDFFKTIKISNLRYSGRLLNVFFKNKKDSKSINIQTLEDYYFEIIGELQDKKGCISIKTMDHNYKIHLKYNQKSFGIVFQDFHFVSDFKFKKGKLFYKNHILETTFNKQLLKLKHKDFISEINFKKSNGFFQCQKYKPVSFSYFIKNHQFNFLLQKGQSVKYDFQQKVGFILFDESSALFKNGVLKNIKVRIKEYQKFHNIEADGFITLNGSPYLNLSSQFLNKYFVQVDIDPKMIFFKTEYFDGSVVWDFKKVYLKSLNIQEAILKHDALIYPYIDNLELMRHKKNVFQLKNCNYTKFEKLLLDWDIYFNHYFAHLKADLKKDETYDGFLFLDNVKTPYLEKIFNVHLKAKKNDLDMTMTVNHKSIVKGRFHLDKKEGELILNTDSQEYNVHGNEMIGVVKGQIKILKDWKLKGQILVENGYFENVGIGLILNQINSKVNFDNDHVDFQFLADQCRGSGNFNIKTQTSSYRLDFKGYDVLQSDMLLMKITGYVEGILYPFYAKGKINLDKGVVTIYESPLNQSFEIIHIQKPSNKNTFPISCDLELNVDKTLELNAFGFSSMWMGKLLVKMRDGKILTDGKFDALKGDFEILGRPMFLKEGHIIFDEKDSLNPGIYLLFERSVEDKILNVSLRGRVQNLTQMTFSSTPTMSQEDVISYLLFSTNTQTLSYYQVARLAYFLTTMGQKQSGFQKVASAIDIKKIENVQTNTAEQVLSIGKEFKNTKIALERELGEPTTSVVLEHKLTPHLLGIVSVTNQGEIFNMRDTLSLEAMLRYVKNY